MNIPNILSILRLVLTPVFIYVYFGDPGNSGIKAALVYAIAGLTDALDGFIARRFGLSSNLGRILDPLGDKLITFAALVCVTIDQIIPVWAVILFFIKESLMGIGSLILYRRIKDTPPSNIYGKLSTIIFFVVCFILIIGKTSLQQPIPDILISVAMLTVLIAFGSYLIRFITMHQNMKGSAVTDSEGEEPAP